LTEGAGTSAIINNTPEGKLARGKANPGGINVLDIPSNEYEDLIRTHGKAKGDELFWQKYNLPFLEDAFKRGDDVRLLSDPNNPATRTGFYKRELDVIEGPGGLAEKYGYRYDAASASFVKDTPRP
jgi:hypothetical protein